MLPVCRAESLGINVSTIFCLGEYSLNPNLHRTLVLLVQLLLVIVFLLWEVLLPSKSSILVIPYRWSLKRLVPDIDESKLTLHPYFTSGLLFVSVTTLVLFFASGMYSEKIAYANRYVALFPVVNAY